MENSEIIKMGYVIQDFLQKEKLNNVKPKELMAVLIEKGFFKRDQKEGLPLRKVLRELDGANLLYLLPQVNADRKNVNIMWFFSALEI